jgi:hypothetical protein
MIERQNKQKKKRKGAGKEKELGGHRNNAKSRRNFLKGKHMQYFQIFQRFEKKSKNDML